MSVAMFDDVTLSLIPPNPQAVAAYVDGRFANLALAQQMFPLAHILSIAVFASHDADCLDIERGDATNEQAPGWYKRQRSLKPSQKPVLYTSASNINALVATMAAAGVARSQYLIWSAHYNFVQHICGPGTCGFPTADGTQWTDKALGRSLDQSLLSDEFFARPKPPAPKPVTGTAHAAVTVHLDRKHNVFEVHGTAGPAHFDGPDKELTAIIKLNLKTGQWTIHKRGISL